MKEARWLSYEPAANEPVVTQRWRTFARKPPFGSVAQVKDGTIVIVANGQALCLGEANYWSLMEMLSEASRRITEEAARTTKRPARRAEAARTRETNKEFGKEG